MRQANTAEQLRTDDGSPARELKIVPAGSRKSASASSSLSRLARICIQPGTVPSLSAKDWSALVELALQHGVAPLLYRQTQGQAIPPATRMILATLYRHNLARNMVLQREQENLLESLRRDSIPVMALKGPQLAELLYGDVGARQVADLDVLIQPSCLEKTNAILISQGYGRVTGDPLASLQSCRDVLYEKDRCGGGKVVLDLHQRLRPYGARDVLTDLLWREGMTAENLLLVLCLNVVTHRFARLQPWMDLATFLGAQECVLNWERFRKNALRLEWPAGVYFCLRFASQLARRRLPDTVLQTLVPGAATRWWVETFLGPDVESLLDRAAELDGPRGTLAAWACEKGFGPKLALGAAVLFPPGAALRQMDPEGAFHSLPLHYAERFTRKALRLARPTPIQ